ncbi:MAG: glycosyltransferase [Acidobacteriia bacterium]|nr:glycosyltransferase [Terriglobia bacterium]
MAISLSEVSIIVCTIGRPEALEACVSSLEPFQAQGAEVVVVYNRPANHALEEIRVRHQVRVVDEPRRGLGSARNAGIRASTGTVLAFLDDDARADPNWIPRLLAPLADPEVLAVVGSVWAQTVADPVSQAFDCLYRAHLPESQLLLDAPREKHPFPIRLAMRGTGSNMAIRREAFERFGYFDGRFGRGTRIGSGEETDLLLRLLRGGAKLVVEPAAGIFHCHPTEWRALRRWAFQSGCAHTAILMKYFLQEPSLRGSILRYAALRILGRKELASPISSQTRIPRLPFLLGSLYGPLAFLLSRKK